MNHQLARLHVILGSLYILIFSGLILLIFFASTSDIDAFSIFCLFYFLTLVCLHFKAHIEVKKGTNFGKILSRILGGLLLFGFPIGTLIGSAILYYTAQKKWQAVGMPQKKPL